jgi:hypothetical protein
MAYGIYRLAVLVPDVITSEYLATADDLRRAVVDHVTDLGEMDSAVDVLNWRQKGIVSTEANACAAAVPSLGNASLIGVGLSQLRHHDALGVARFDVLSHTRGG